MTEALADTWEELVTVGLLGTDRRDPPNLPAGPLADTVDDALRPTPQGRMLAAVAATVTARRCGVTPSLPRRPLLAPGPDDRPLLPCAAVERWAAIVTEWPVLEAEWLAVASASGWRPDPEVLVALLRRHRRSPVLAAAVLEWGGAMASWIVEHVPDLAPVDGRPQPPSGALRPLPVPAELEPLLRGPANELASTLVDGLSSGRYRWAHRAVLLNAVARLDEAALPVVAAVLRECRDTIPGDEGEAAPLALWEALIELAVARREMLGELRAHAPRSR